MTVEEQALGEPTGLATPAGPTYIPVEVLPEAAQGFLRNWRPIAILAVLAALTGSMVGSERTLASLIAKNEFGIASTVAALSFLITFGLAKAFTNLGAGRLADRYGRRRLLIFGWVVAIPVPFVVILAPSWSYIVVANALLGINQGLDRKSVV